MEIQAYVDIQCTRSKNEALLCEFLQNLWLVYPKFARKQIQYNAMLNVVPNVVSAPCTSCTKVLRYQWVGMFVLKSLRRYQGIGMFVF